MKICIVIPAYNEAENIERVVKDIQDNAPECDYIIINDCSTDNEKEVIEKNGFNAIHLPINLGLSGAVQTGYKYAYEHGYDAVIQFDGDGQHKACYIPVLAKVLEEGYDISIGSRFVTEKKDMSMRMMGSRIIST
ncbi:MAG: glycosyltransferase family 2 protein, partial [Erysipelotrichaceae bacterium]|nr:glycosyltransferase family 2 protein [Erysipelotrichaceae bacterium]